MANLAPVPATKAAGSRSLEMEVVEAGKAAVMEKFEKELDKGMKSCESARRKELSDKLRAEHGVPAAPDRQMATYDPKKFAEEQHDFKAAQKEHKDVSSTIDKKAKIDAHLECAAEKDARIQEKKAALDQATAKLLHK